MYRSLLKFNAYAWALCSAGWGWVAHVRTDAMALIVAMASLTVAWVCAALYYHSPED